MADDLGELKSRLAEIADLGAASAVMVWDQRTHMPPGGAAARARQLATISRLSHERLADPALGELLERLKGYEATLDRDSDDASLIRVARRDHERAIRVPASFVTELRAHASATYQVWGKARPANDFGMVRPYLEKSLELSRQYASYFPGYQHIADPLLDDAEEGWKTSEVQGIFAELREQLVPIVSAITSQAKPDNSFLMARYPESEQLALGLDVVRQLGYDLSRGRQDKTLHPFEITFSVGDVRITTRVDEHDLKQALFGTIHEAGHGLYEQGGRPEFEPTPLAGGTSPGFHESQSRLWENLVGRSRPFWTHFYPVLQKRFPGQLGAVSLDSFYRAINRVEQSLIRVEADEVTYNLHVMLRFDLELAMLEGRLAVKDLPDAWRERMRADLGVAPLDDRDGVLQDVHWYSGLIGGRFQGYTLGNILSAQLFETAVRARPSISKEMERGDFGTLRSWLTENIYRHGRKFPAPDLVVRATGAPLSVQPFVRYLRTKYAELYNL